MRKSNRCIDFQRRLSYMEIEAFEKGNIKELKTDKFAHENAQFLPYNKDYEIPSTDFEICKQLKIETPCPMLFSL